LVFPKISNFNFGYYSLWISRKAGFEVSEKLQHGNRYIFAGAIFRQGDFLAGRQKQGQKE